MYWAAMATASSSWQSWLYAPCDQVYGKTDQINPMQRREQGMEDERKSRRMRGWNGCTHKEGRQREKDGREGGGCCGGGSAQGSISSGFILVAEYY